MLFRCRAVTVVEVIGRKNRQDILTELHYIQRKVLAKTVSAREKGRGAPYRAVRDRVGPGIVSAADKHQTEAGLLVRIHW